MSLDLEVMSSSLVLGVEITKININKGIKSTNIFIECLLRVSVLSARSRRVRQIKILSPIEPILQAITKLTSKLRGIKTKEGRPGDSAS